MLTPTHARTDNTYPVITLGLDGEDTEHEKKFKCSECGQTVFSYMDTLKLILPGDARFVPEDEKIKGAKALDQIQCTHTTFDDNGKRTRCNTFYIILRGKLGVVDG